MIFFKVTEDECRQILSQNRSKWENLVDAGLACKQTPAEATKIKADNKIGICDLKIEWDLKSRG